MKTKFIFLLLISLFLGVSCQKESTTSKEGITGNPGTVTGSDANANLKSTLTGFQTQWVKTTDIIGFYSDNATIGGVAPANSALAALTSGINTQFGVDPSFTWGSMGSAHNFWAYYPYASGNPGTTTVPIALPNAQAQSIAGSTAHVGALDFMVATPVNKIAGDQTSVNFQFNHVFTVLDITATIKQNRYLKSLSLTGPAGAILAFTNTTTKINITSIPTGNFTFQTISGESNVVTVTMTTRPTKTDTHVFMVINPGTYSGVFTFTANTVDVDGLDPKVSTTTKTNMALTRGKIYTVAMSNIN